MDDVFLHPFNSISVISRQWEGDNERLYMHRVYSNPIALGTAKTLWNFAIEFLPF